MDDRPEADLRLLTERGVRVLLAHCEWDPNYDYFRVTRGDEVGSLTIDGMLEVATIEGMNHDFYLLQGQNDVLNVVLSLGQVECWDHTQSGYQSPECGDGA